MKPRYLFAALLAIFELPILVPVIVGALISGLLCGLQAAAELVRPSLHAGPICGRRHDSAVTRAAMG